MGWRREPPLAGLLQGRPLVGQIQTQRMRIARTLAQHIRTTQHEANSRHAFQAFIRRRCQRVKRSLPRVDRQGAKGAHRVDQQPSARRRRHRRDVFNGIKNARRRFALHNNDMRNRQVIRQSRRHYSRVGGNILVGFIGAVGPAQIVANRRNPVAIGTVDQDQRFTVTRQERRDHRFDREGATALQRHRDMTALTIREFNQAVQHPPVHGDERRVP